MGDKRSGWFYVFVSCGVLLLIGVIVVGAGTFMTIRWAKGFQEEMEDPEKRTANANQVMREIMGVNEAPAGFHPQIAIEAPFGLFQLLILTDGDPLEDADDIEDAANLFVYIEGPGWDKDWKAFARGGEPPFDNLDDMNINVRRSDVIGKGELTVGNMELAYLANRGEFSAESFSSDGVFTVILVRCPDGDKRSRTIVWGGPDAKEPTDELTGTAGDPERIAEMVGHFRLCGA